MSVTTSEAIAAVRARINAGTYSFPVYYHGDDPPILPDTPEPFAFVVFNNEGSSPVSFGGGRGESIYRNRARVDIFFFHPDGYGPEVVCDLAESIAVRLRSYRNDFISCFSSDVVFEGPGSNLSVPGLAGPINNYAAAIVECMLIYDQSGGGIVDVAPPDTGAPDWVPANAKIHIDFVGGTPQGRAWSNGAEVAIDTLLGSDPNSESAWGETSYDPANLTEDGYTDNGQPAVLGMIGTCKGYFIAGSTTVLRWVISSSHLGATINLVAASADGISAIEYDAHPYGDLDLHASSWTGSYDVTVSGVVNAELNSFAITLTPTRSEFAVNGSSVQADVLTTDEFPVSGDSQIVVGIIDVGDTHLQSITIYDPLPDTTGLSDLSNPL